MELRYAPDASHLSSLTFLNKSLFCCPELVRPPGSADGGQVRVCEGPEPDPDRPSHSRGASTESCALPVRCSQALEQAWNSDPCSQGPKRSLT